MDSRHAPPPHGAHRAVRSVGSVLSRRTLLAATAAAAGVALVGLPATAAAQGTPATTPDGWPVDGAIAPVTVEGSGVVVALRTGAATTVLAHVLRRFHLEVAALAPGDVVGHLDGAPDGVDHRSGTAVAVLPGRLPAGASGGLFPHEVVVVRDILADCEGTVRWGGDDPAVPREGNFRIDVPPHSARLQSVSERLLARRGRDAGPQVDPHEPARRDAAMALARRQAR